MAKKFGLNKGLGALLSSGLDDIAVLDGRVHKQRCQKPFKQQYQQPLLLD